MHSTYRSGLGHCPNPACPDYFKNKVSKKNNFCTSCGTDLMKWQSNLVTPAMLTVGYTFSDWAPEDQDNDYFIIIHRLATAHGHMENIARDPLIVNKKNSTYTSSVPLNKPIRISWDEALANTCCECNKPIDVCACQTMLTYWDVVTHVVPTLYDQPSDMYETWMNRKSYDADKKSCFNCDAFLTASCTPLLKALASLSNGETPGPISPCEEYVPDEYMEQVASTHTQ